MATHGFLDWFGGSFHLLLQTEQHTVRILAVEETGLGGEVLAAVQGGDLLSRPLSSGNVSFSPPSQLIN